MERYGICHLAYMPLRGEPSHKAENISQVLFGEIFKVIDTYNKEWYFIELEFDKYRGWITSSQIQYMSYPDYRKISLNQRFFSGELYQRIFSRQLNNIIPYGSHLPFGSDKIKVGSTEYMVEGRVIDSSAKKSISWLLDEAKKFLGVPYLWGGKSFLGFDCSGYIQTLYKVFGIDLPRDAYQQFDRGEEVLSSSIKAGDLAYFTNDDGRIIHVGMIMDDGKIIHASGHVRIDVIDERGIYNQDLRTYTHQLKKIKRVISN